MTVQRQFEQKSDISPDIQRNWMFLRIFGFLSIKRVTSSLKRFHNKICSEPWLSKILTNTCATSSCKNNIKSIIITLDIKQHLEQKCLSGQNGYCWPKTRIIFFSIKDNRKYCVPSPIIIIFIIILALREYLWESLEQIKNNKIFNKQLTLIMVIKEKKIWRQTITSVETELHRAITMGRSSSLFDVTRSRTSVANRSCNTVSAKLSNSVPYGEKEESLNKWKKCLSIPVHKLKIKLFNKCYLWLGSLRILEFFFILTK